MCSSDLGPGAQFTGYATRIVVASRLGKLTFYNSDIVQHDVTGDNGLFGSPLVGLGQSIAVTGLQSLVAGQRYTFHCSIHPGMRGTLWVTK